MRRLIATVVFCLLGIPVRAEDCVASVYAVGDSSQRGTKTASGRLLHDKALTAAHKSLPFGSKVKVTNKKNGHAVTPDYGRLSTDDHSADHPIVCRLCPVASQRTSGQCCSGGVPSAANGLPVPR